MTQFEINGCANEEYSLAFEEMESIVSQIQLPAEELEQLKQIQTAWIKQAVFECDFFYGQLEKGPEGSLYYRNGSMAPMRRGWCLAERVKFRIDEIKDAYLP